jgi:hypothetical protein
MKYKKLFACHARISITAGPKMKEEELLCVPPRHIKNALSGGCSAGLGIHIQFLPALLYLRRNNGMI